MSALLFGSIGTLADTSEMQRESFNEAFAEHDLDWNWSRDEYRELLRGSGGAQRIAEYAQRRGDDVDADAVHATKSERFRAKLAADGAAPRPGVAETIEQATADGRALALVTTTSPENVAALADALAPEVDLETFALLVDISQVPGRKPEPDAYLYAVARLGERVEDCVAVEDNVGGVEAATAAGIATIAFPGENNAGHDFSGAARTVDTLSIADVQSVGDLS